MSDLLHQLRQFYADLEPTRRRALLAAGATSLLVVLGVGVWATQPRQVVLAQASSADEITTLTRALGQQGVPFEVDPDGRTIRVPSTVEIDARRAVADLGLPAGLESLSTIPAFVTPGQEHLYEKRMLQGELVRMIDALSGVASSDVQISLPERTAWLRDRARATASVTLHPDPGTAVDPGAARSVAQLVAHAVADMTAADVTVVDASTMRVLWGDGAGEAGDAGDLGHRASAREAALTTAVRGALGQVLGDPSASSVTVRVELETAAVETTTRSVDPDQTVATSERIETETDSRASSAAEGVPGTDSNLPERTASTGTATTGRQRETQSTTYEFGSSVSTISRPPGELRRLSATVLVDSAAFARVVATGDEAAVRRSMEAAVRAALGAVEARGDTVVFEVLPFTPPAPAAPAAVPTPAVAWAEVLPSAAVVLAVVLGFVFFVRPLMRALSPPATAAPAPSPEAEPPIDLAARLRARVAGLAPHSPHELSALVAAESEQSAEVLRRWIRHQEQA